jgi:rod shape-determining protein MreC
VILTVVQNQARAQNRVDPVSQVIRTIIAPGASVGSQGTQALAAGWDGLGQGPRLKLENEILRKKIGALRIYQSEAQALAMELGSLEKLTSVDPGPGRTRIIGRIIGYFPHEHRLTLDIGSDKGIQPNLAVMGNEGIAGVVETVSGSTCQVLLVTSASARVGARVVRDVPSFGLARGVSQDRLSMEVAGTSPVDVGDKVVTSGLSEWIPGGLPIGEIVEVAPRPEFGTKQLAIFPSLRLSAGSRLAVLK